MDRCRVNRRSSSCGSQRLKENLCPQTQQGKFHTQSLSRQRLGNFRLHQHTSPGHIFLRPQQNHPCAALRSPQFLNSPRVVGQKGLQDEAGEVINELYAASELRFFASRGLD